MINRKLEETSVIRDCIHGNIIIEYKIIQDLINTDVFQRLRRIHQLGGTFMVYPTAEHSRFTHSLGVYAVVNKIIKEVEDVNANLSEHQKIVVLCAGLLHDIGHGPFSHAFEEVFSTNHEQMGIDMIKSDTSVYSVLESYEKGLASQVASVIEKTHPNTLMIQLISSQVDADRMDYLLRDAYNCGVSYGNFDIGRLLRSMVVVDNKIAFKESGVHAIEDYIFARYHMYWQVYLHPTATSYEIIFSKIMKRYIQLYKDGYEFNINTKLLEPFVKHKVTSQDYLNLDESSINYYISQFQFEKDEILANLSQCFIKRGLFKYKDILNVEQGIELIKEAEKDLEKQKYYFEIRKVKGSFYDYYGALNTQSIIIQAKDKSLTELYNASPLVNAIVESAKLKKAIKLYFHHDYMNEIKEGY
ncbi:HD domain-containing protein [Mycoplasma sp. P36-A1]|uniref:HD domain-containing protein n=1 Tax=Mycoplasma sp. P36-A1 TaxID=3252900 RepID=UPI003C2DEC9B